MKNDNIQDIPDKLQNEADIEKIEISIDTAKKHINNAEAFKRLQKNADFKKIIEEGYFENNTTRLVFLMTDPQFESEAKQILLKNEMIAISGLFKYFKTITVMGDQYKQALLDDENTQSEILREDL